MGLLYFLIGVVVGAASLALFAFLHARRQSAANAVVQAEEDEAEVVRYKRLAHHIHVQPEDGESDAEFVARFKARYLRSNQDVP